MFQFTPSSFGQPQNNVSASSQFQPMPQMHAAAVPGGGQPWLTPGSNGVSVATAVQPTGQQPSVSSSSDAVYAFSLFLLLFGHILFVMFMLMKIPQRISVRLVFDIHVHKDLDKITFLNKQPARLVYHPFSHPSNQ